ncbi:nitronate monooxygenase [Rhodanobacter sp. PCA2]|uniref:NAD(P)H-dependent flavin oxidoreductase n=1 Tax=Rhodanobacter sp. PCA2 TaxID=2006117 RepID=UPI0015E767E4|nr:nitronate monooxygenase [Rhodanobacter sp. PCA2]MBA2080090.1 2-nitropropane dioxygenase [Rhodanobacter sp. PCA2]
MHAALRTPLLDRLGCRYPIMLAGMGGVARSRLAAAVANAGGFAVMGMVREPVALIEREVAALRAATRDDLHFAVNLIPASCEQSLLRAQVDACLRLRVPAMALFWEVDGDLVRHLKAEGVQVIHQVGSCRDAELALDAGCDVLIAQGVDAGGHVRGEVSTFALLPEIVALAGEVPVAASGAIASGAALVAALALGAQAVSLGSAFLATEESFAHPHHRQRLVAARAEDTVRTTVFARNWKIAAPVRVLPNAVTRGDYDGCSEAEKDQPIAWQDGGQPVYPFSTDSPAIDATGRIDDMAIYAGESVGQIHDIVHAGERVAQLVREAEATLARLRPAD